MPGVLGSHDSCTVRVSQNFKSMDIWYFPHLMSVLGYSRIENHKDLASRVNGHRSHSTYILQRKLQKNTKEILKSQYFEFLAVKLIHKFFNGLGLHSWDHYASFDTHIAISRNRKCQMPYMSFMSKMPKCHIWHMPSDTYHV